MSQELMWLIFFLVAAVLLVFSTVIKKRFSVLEVTIIGVMAALAYVAYLFLRIPLTMNGSTSSIHFGNMFPAITALILDAPSGGLAGAIGLALADVMDGKPHYAITTFILKYLIGFVCGTVAHKGFKLKELTPKMPRYYIAVVVSMASGLLLNIVTDPFLGYFRKVYIQGLDTKFATVLTTISGGASAVNAVLCTIVGVILYLALRPALHQSGLMNRLNSMKKNVK